MHTEFWWDTSWKTPFESLRRTWENNIKMDLRKVGCKNGIQK